MLIEIFLVIILGLLFGAIVGIIPGAHPNTIAVLLLSLSPFLLQFTTPIILAVFIIVVTVVNSIVDSIPSIYLGAPDDSGNILSVLPGHKLLLEGRGHEAVLLTIVGSLAGLILAVAFTPILIPFLKIIYPLLKDYIAYILIFVILLLIFKEKSRFWALIVFLMSGVLGLGVLNMSTLKEPLFPMLSGLFGISGLFLSLKTKPNIPKQLITGIDIKNKPAYKAIGTSLFSGALVSILPGVGSAQAAILGSSIIREVESKSFLIMVGGINTVNFIISFASLYVLDKSRNGSIVAVSKILEAFNLNYLILFIGVTLISGGISVFLAIYISKIFAKYILKIKYNILCISIIIFVTILVIWLTGILGLFVLFISTTLGLIPPLKNIGRNHLMGCLILPVILYFLL